MIIGHQKQWDFLKKTAETAEFSHAYLFSGLEKLGKKTLALKWVSFLFGQSVENLTNHPDLIFIKPLPPDSDKFTVDQDDKSSSLPSFRKQGSVAKEEIRISQIKDLIWRLSLKPALAKIKAAIIDNAHLMNREAQTCLLKTLEEPRGETLLILISDKPQELFPTILSRVQIIKFYPVNNQEIKDYLKKQQIDEKDLEEISEIAWGRPGIAVDFVSNSQKINLFREKIKEIEKISKADLAFRFQYVKELSTDPQKTRETLDIWTSYFRKKLINATSSRQSTSELRKILNFLQKTNFLISTTNVNSRMALDALMIEI